MTPDAAFTIVTSRLVKDEDGVQRGRMMSSPALTFGGKVFCFFYNDDMVFRLGSNAGTGRAELAGWRWLAPFKNKGPMRGWYVVPLRSPTQWETLAREALALLKAGS